MKSDKDLYSIMSADAAKEIMEAEDKRFLDLIDGAVKEMNTQKEEYMLEKEGKEKFMVNFSFHAEDADEARFFVQSIINWVNSIPNLESPLNLEKLASFKDIINEINSLKSEEKIQSRFNNDGTLRGTSKSKELKKFFYDNFKRYDSTSKDILKQNKAEKEFAKLNEYDVDYNSLQNSPVHTYEHGSTFNFNGVEFSIGSLIDYQKYGSSSIETGRVLNFSQSLDSNHLIINVINTINGNYEAINTANKDVLIKKD